MPTEAMFHVYEASPQRAGARRSSTYDEGSMRARLVRVRGGFPIPSPAQIDELGRIAIRRFLELSPERLASPRLGAGTLLQAPISSATRFPEQRGGNVLDALRRYNLAMISSYTPMMRRQLLATHFLMSSMPQRALDDLVKFTTVARFAPHREIFSKGDPGDCLYGILAGRVRIFSSSPEGDEILLNVLEAGELFGEIAMLDGSTRTASAAAMEQTDLMRIHRDHFLPYVRANPDLLLSMLTLLCNRLRWSSSIIEDTAFLPLPARLAKRLLVLGEHYRQPDTQVVTVPLSQHELGSMIGVSREATNKQLAIWRSAGIVETAPRAIIIRKSEALRDLIGCT